MRFNSVDLDKALEAIVVDGDKGFLEPFYFSPIPEQDFGIHIFLRNPEMMPDTSDWTVEQDDHFTFHCEVHYTAVGEWSEACYNIENNMVERFDPETLRPKPLEFPLYGKVENYKDLAKVTDRIKQEGYHIESLSLTTGQNMISPFRCDFHIGRYDEGNRYSLKYNKLKFAKTMVGKLIPGL